MAGTLGVQLHDRFKDLKWISNGAGDAYELTAAGEKALDALSMNIDEMRASRRRFAYACLDWSERRPHIGGALGSALLDAAIKRKWVTKDLDSRAIRITNVGRREMLARFGLEVE
jgi:hypothetical protein